MENIRAVIRSRIYSVIRFFRGPNTIFGYSVLQKPNNRILYIGLNTIVITKVITMEIRSRIKGILNRCSLSNSTVM